jgi:hypothetical protein
VPSLIKGRPNNNNTNNNKAKCIPGGKLRVLAGKKIQSILKQVGNPTSTTSQLKTRDSKDSARA